MEKDTLTESFTIEIDKLLEEAVDHMEHEDDVRWSVGMALQEIYWSKGWAEVQERLSRLYVERRKSSCSYCQPQTPKL